MMEVIRSWRILHLMTWSLAILFAGLFTGAAAVIAPPMMSIGIVALAGLALLWAMPELHAVPERLLRKMFFIMIFVYLCVPAYYAIETGVLPWISARRLVAATMIFLFGITVAGSKAARDKILETIQSVRPLAFLSIGFLALLFVSILTSRAPAQALNGFVDSVLVWYVPLFACIFVVRTERDIILVLKIVAVAGIVDAALGGIEFILERRFYFDVFPQDMLDSMLASNPALEMMYTMSSYRHGIYRASSIYTVPLSFGELAAMVAPIGAYFFFHSEKAKWRLFGMMTVIASFGSLLVSGARGGFVAFLVAMPVMLFLRTVRYAKQNRGSIITILMAAFALIGTSATMGLILFSGKLSKRVFGGSETAGSTSARFEQFNMALPNIVRNPVTGYGRGSSGEVVGFYTPGSELPTVDSYVITLLVEQGVTGFLLFFGMIAFGIWIAARLYIGSADERATLGAPIACSLLAFATYRPVLSQTENHTLMFLMIGLVFALARVSQNWRSEAKYSRSPFSNPVMWQRPTDQPRSRPTRIQY
jgi:O-antigen ligase